ncbi:MAG TPA: hypothetical protein VNL15_01325, partial [Dehalococcoidia bacterium]|nr:hypothetical protein [Dehalococcoidia bacterium]
TSAIWAIRNADGSDSVFSFGTFGDIPVPADYDGNGIDQMSVWRPATFATWHIRNASGGADVFSFGTFGDKPVPADYDGW